MKGKKSAAMWRYVIFTYLLFWVMVLGICGTASMVFHAPSLTMRWLANLCAWSPTIALLVMFRRLEPNTTLREFYKQSFSGKIQLNLLVISACSVIGGTLLSVWVSSIIQQKNYASFFSLGMYSLPLTVALSILSGPTGEESGWRGYLRKQLETQYGFVKSALLLGVIWAFWHTVLWFVDSDFAGWSLISYILSNVIVMTSLTIIMNVILKESNNLFYAIWVHFCFNFMYGFLKVDIWFYVYLSVIYSIIAICYLLFYFKKLNIAKSQMRQSPFVN